MIGWVAYAAAAPVVCDPSTALHIVEQARIAPERVPVTHPHLVPGLALAQEPVPSQLREALEALCGTPQGEPPRLTVDRGEAWDGPNAAAYEIEVARAEREDCGLVQRRLAISVGVGPAGTTYRLLDTRPVDRTALPGCQTLSRWHHRTTVAGELSPVRLVLGRQYVGDNVVHSRVVVMRADATGWRAQELMAPAPASKLAIGTTPSGESWVVASAGAAPPHCAGPRGQTVWRWREGQWAASTGREALTLLARAGLWRLAGDAGWFLILAQGEEADEPLLKPRLRRLGRRSDEPLFLFRSSAFPGLNPGYMFISPGPWPSRQAAEASRRPSQRGGYVKQGWDHGLACEPSP